MKIILFSLLITVSTTLLGQTNDSTGHYKLTFEVSVIQPLLGGFGATVGTEKEHIGFGLIGYGATLDDMVKHYLMENVEGLAVFNWGAELYADYYVKQNHRGLFLGAVVSLNGYKFTDIPEPQTILALYVAPRVGYRIYFPKKLSAFYVQPAITFQVKLWDNTDDFLYQKVNLSSGFLLSQLTIGIKI